MGGSATFFGGTGGKIGLNVEKWSFSQRLSREVFRLSVTHQNTLFYTFLTKFTPSKLKKHQKSLKTVFF